MPNTRPNPYVGPRSFHTGEKLYGRERETLELLDLIIAERIVLLYSPSGAGKTSLIQAALFPKLRAEGFAVLPPLRVNAELPPEAKGANRFVLSTLLSLEENVLPEKRLPMATLARLTFDEYMRQRADLNGASPVLLFDQFEEILTVEPMNVAAKIAFFEQIGEALKNRERWALFSMREDYLAGLDPYVKPIPTRFATTYRLDLLGVNAAYEAIQKPAQEGGVNFTDAAAGKLINDLRQVQVQRPDGTMELQPGLYVEPVQLQVVCLRLWNNIPQTKNEIVESDIANVGDVNSALASYYELRVLAVSTGTGESERTIREWFDRQLITEQGIRGQVMMEPERSRGLSNTAIRMFEDAHLVRADERRGATWFELAHDRLIEPLRASNAKWFRENLSAFQLQADLWNRQGRPDSLLMRDQGLAEAEKWAQAHPKDLTAVEQSFLSESLQARAIRDKEQKQNRRIRFLAIGATVLSVIALIGIGIALISLAQLGQALTDADGARQIAVASRDEANQSKAEVVVQERVSKMTNAALAQLNVDPEVSLLLALDAYSTTKSVQTDDILRQAVTESRVRGALRGHTDSVSSVAISSDGKFFATGSGDQTAILWDAATGEKKYVLKGHTAPIWSVTFSPDGKTLLTTSGDPKTDTDPTARLWDLTKCKDTTCPSRELTGHTKTVWGGAFSPDGSVVVTVDDAGVAKRWQTATGNPLGDIAKHSAGINAVAYSPDGHYLATVSSDQTAQVTDLTTCQGSTCSFQTFQTQAGLWNVAFSPDSKYMVVASDDQNAYKVNLATNSVEIQFSGHSDAVLGVAYSPDGRYIATGSRDGTARLWDANTGQTIAVLRGHNSSVWSVAFTPDSRLVLTGSADKTARLWDISDSAALRVLRGTLAKVLGADYSGDGKRVITVGADRMARVWDVETGNIIATLVGHTGWVTDGALNQNGTRAATASFDGTARIWDLTKCGSGTNQPGSGTNQPGSGTNQPGSGTNQPDCPFIELKGHTGTVRSVTFSPDQKWVLTAGDDGTVRLWDATTGAPVSEVKAHDDTVNHASFSSDGKMIVTAGNEGGALVLAVKTDGGKVTLDSKAALLGHTGAVNNASFNQDGTLVVTASDDRTARIWDLAHCPLDGSSVTCPFKELKGHLGAVTGAVFTQDGKFIVTGSADKTARVWDVNTAETLSILRGHTDKVQTVELSSDDHYVMTASSDKTVRIVPLRIQDVLDVAKTRVTRALSCDEWVINIGDPNYCPGGGVSQNAAALPTLAPIAQVAVTDATATPQAGEAAPTSPPPQSPTPLPTTPPTPTIATAGPTETAAPDISGTPAVPSTAVLKTVVPFTATPRLASGVYITSIVYVPLDAPNFQFKVTFLNTTGAPVTYGKWLVPFFEPGAKNSIGAPKGNEKIIPVGTSEQVTEPWKVGVGQCSPYTARPASADQEGRQTPLMMPDGQPAALDFQICP